MGKLSQLELRVNPNAQPTSEAHTPAYRSLVCSAKFYTDKVLREDYEIKTIRARAQYSWKPPVITTDPVTWGDETFDSVNLQVDLPSLMAYDQAIVASELVRHATKVQAYRDHADTLGKAVNVVETELRETQEELQELQALLNETLERLADREDEVKKLKATTTPAVTPARSKNFLSARAKQALLATPSPTTPGQPDFSHLSAMSQAPLRPKLSAKAEDPPKFTGEDDVDFDHWKDLLIGKLLHNADHFMPADGDLAMQEDARVHYTKTRVAGRALGQLVPYLKAKERRDEAVTTEDIVNFLERTFKDTNQRSKAKADLRQIKMKPAQDFRDFEANFTRLANKAELPLEQWKDEIHNALPGQLRVHMETYCNDPLVSFYAYTERARQIAFSLQRAAAESSERRAQRNQERTNRQVTLKPIASPTPAPKLKTPLPVPKTDGPTCFMCRKTGHISRDCPQAENKAVETIDQDQDLDLDTTTIVESDSEDEAGKD